MIYLIDFRKQALLSIKDGMNIREAANFYQLSTSSIHSLVPQKTRNKAPTKISSEALLKDVKQHPDDYLYELARRFNYSKTGMYTALKHLGISQKKDLGTSKGVSNKKGNISE
ncbi:IS630 transposase-related protein [Psychrobacter sp. 16-MNA-CIBAN-0192]|uniref:IS630 transposase-related protein n=1 Tax=Psychrobacter sp. 16-MNA-CIBAN-0192 TaxID=3140448 RepID=UPI00332010E2